MTVSRLYATGKNLSMENLSAKIGTDKIYYRTKHIHKIISDSPEGIAYIPLIFNSVRDFFHIVNFPLIASINRDDSLICSSIYGLKEADYIKINRSEPKTSEQDYYVKSVFLHRKLIKEGKLDETVEINNEEYKVRSLSFDEMMKNGKLHFFTVGELLIQPLTKSKMMQTTGYSESTVKKSLSSLRYCDLIENRLSEGKHRFSLCGDMEKVSKFFETSRKKKMNRISRMKKFLEVKNMHNSRIGIEEICKQTELNYSSIRGWVYLDKKPKISDKIAQIFSNQGLLSKEEIETFRNYGLIEQTIPYTNAN